MLNIIWPETDPPAVKTLKAVISLDAGLTLKGNSQKAKPPVTIKDVWVRWDDDRKKQSENRLSKVDKLPIYLYVL